MRLKCRQLLFFVEALNSEKVIVSQECNVSKKVGPFEVQQKKVPCGKNAASMGKSGGSVGFVAPCHKFQEGPHFFTALVKSLISELRAKGQSTCLPQPASLGRTFRTFCYSSESQTCSGFPGVHPINVNVTALEHLTEVWVGLGWIAIGS